MVKEYNGVSETIGVTASHPLEKSTPLSYEWSIEGGDIISDATGVSYTVKNVSDSATYVVKVSITVESETASAEIEIPVEISRKPMTVTADDKTMVFGETVPALTATVAGRLGEDVIAYELSRAEGVTVGTYVITVTGSAN